MSHDAVAYVEADAGLICDLSWDLRKMGAHSLSFVTAEHFTPLVVEVCRRLRSQGFDLPFVHNTSGWISVESIDDLFPFINIWLWDCKTHDGGVASQFFGDSGYVGAEKDSFAYLMDKVRMADNVKDSCGISGGASDDANAGLPQKNPEVIVRHLMVPGHIESTIRVIKDFAQFKDRCMFSLMTQYMDVSGDGSAVAIKEIRRAERALEAQGIEQGWVQQPNRNELEWMPDFSRTNPFPSTFAAVSPLFEGLRMSAKTSSTNICQMKK